MGELSVKDGCYLCSNRLGRDEVDADHVIPKSLFPLANRENLITLPTHAACNRSYSKDDEYFRLCMTVAASSDSMARELWDGPVMRGFHRPRSRGFKTSILEKVVDADIHSENGAYLGTSGVMLQDVARIRRIVNRIVRGLYGHLTGTILSADWPVSADLLDPAKLQPYADVLQMQFVDVGGGTFLYGWQHLEDDREGWFWLVFFGLVHFWGYTGLEIRSHLPW